MCEQVHLSADHWRPPSLIVGAQAGPNSGVIALQLPTHSWTLPPVLGQGKTTLWDLYPWPWSKTKSYLTDLFLKCNAVCSIQLHCALWCGLRCRICNAMCLNCIALHTIVLYGWLNAIVRYCLALHSTGNRDVVQWVADCIVLHCALCKLHPTNYILHTRHCALHALHFEVDRWRVLDGYCFALHGVVHTVHCIVQWAGDSITLQYIA